MNYFYLNSNSNNPLERLFFRDFFVNSLLCFPMCLYILSIGLKVVKCSLSGLILLNLQPHFFSIAFCLGIS